MTYIEVGHSEVFLGGNNPPDREVGKTVEVTIPRGAGTQLLDDGVLGSYLAGVGPDPWTAGRRGQTGWRGYEAARERYR